MTSWPSFKARQVLSALYRIGWTLKRQLVRECLPAACERSLGLSEMQELRKVPGGQAVAANQLLYNLTRRGIEWDLLRLFPPPAAPRPLEML